MVDRAVPGAGSTRGQSGGDNPPFALDESLRGGKRGARLKAAGIRYGGIRANWEADGRLGEHMESFSPFLVGIRALQAADLCRLKDVAEGWHVEYKAVVPDAKSIAKSVSSFANQYGGWLFFGIAAESGGDNTPSSYPGVPLAEWPQQQERISSAATSHLSHAPLFEVRAIRGPMPDIHLPADRVVIAVHIQRGLDAPYVHSSGRIYRRVADQSDPRPETDRAALDLLWARRDRAQEAFRDFIEREPALSDAEINAAHMDVFLFCEPVGESGVESALTFASFAAIAASATPEAAVHFDFDNCQSSSRGYYARQSAQGGPLALSASFYHHNDGTTVGSMPIRTQPINSVRSDIELGKYDNGAQFRRLALNAGAGDQHWIDLNIMLTVYSAFVSKHYRLLREAGIDRKSSCKSRFASLRHCVPFVDTASYINFIRQHGIPTIRESEIWSPPGLAMDTCLLLKELDLEDGDQYLQMSGLPWARALSALGLEGMLQSGPDAIEELLLAVVRGIKAHSDSGNAGRDGDS